MRLLTLSTSSDGRKRLVVILMWLPWLWLLLLTLLIGHVYLTTGHLPFHDNPDPRHTRLSALLYYPTLLLTVPLLISPFLWLAVTAGLQDGDQRPAPLRRTTIYLLGYIGFILVVVGDLGMLMTWLLD